MLDSLTLTTIVLGELVFLLTLGCGLLGFVLLRMRRQQNRLSEAYRQLRHNLRTERAQHRQAAAAETSPAKPDAVREYLEQTRDEARERFRNITQATLPRLAPEFPFNAKIAALRFLFCEAEARAWRKHDTGGDPWVLMEKQLHDIARWIVDRQDNRPNRQGNNRIRLLQQRVEKLKGYEKMARDLQRKLDLSHQKSEELEQLQTEHRATIDKLERINRLLSLSGDDSGPELRRELHEIVTNTQGPPSGDDRRLTNIEHFGSDHQRLSQELAQGLRTYSADYPDERSAHLEATIKRLEAELYRSQQHLRSFQPDPRPPSGDGEAPDLSTAGGRADAMEQIQDTLQVIHTDMADSSRALAGAARYSPSQSPYSLEEIQQLRHNNSRQRNLIVDLEGELRGMRTALPDTDTDEGARQAEELRQLEHLVKECEHCILALESEVDLLYNRLHERRQPGGEDTRATDDITLAQLQSELGAMAERLEQAQLSAQRDTILSQFAQATLRAESVEEVARCVIAALKRGELIAGFYLNARLGHAEYFPSGQFSARERSGMRHMDIAGERAYLNEGILFAGQHMRLLLKDPHADEQELAHTEQLMHALLEITDARLNHLERVQAGHHQNRTLHEWAQGAHNTLVDMEIRYAYQAEETLRLLESLTEQLQRACASAELSEATRAVIDNALKEGQHRIYNLFRKDDTIEEGCSQLLGQLDQLPRIAQ